MGDRKLPHRTFVILCVFALSSASCGFLGQISNPIRTAAAKRQAREKELHAQVQGFASLVSATVGDVSAAILDRSEDPAVRELAILWKIRTLKSVRDATHRRVASEACLDIWALAYQMATFFRSGDGSRMFGSHHPLALEATENLERAIDRQMGKVLETNELDIEKKHVREFAERFPMQSSFARTPFEAARAAAAGMFAWLDEFTLNPFSSGISKGANAIEEVNHTAGRFTDVVDDFPMLTRWQFQLLLLDVESNATVKKTMADLEHIARTSEQLVTTVGKMPASIRKEVQTVLADVDARQAGLRDTLRTASTTADQLTKLSESINQASDRMTEMASALGTTLKTFDATVAELVGTDKPESPVQVDGTDRRPFDILDYEKTARAITVMSADLRGTLDEFQNLLADEAIDKRVQRVKSAADHSIQNLSEQMLHTGLILLGALLVVLTAYRFITTRILAPKGEGVSEEDDATQVHQGEKGCGY